MRISFDRFIQRGEKDEQIRPGIIFRLLFLFTGFFATIWFLIRVIPKPSRATYPCMKAAMPLAWSFIAYVLSLTGSVVFFKKAWRKMRMKQFQRAFLAIAIAGILATWALVNHSQKASAVVTPDQLFTDPLGPNTPIGEAKGIFPGRVVWVWDPQATNEDLVGHEDYYWLDEFTNMDVVDRMLSDGLQELTGEESDAMAWEAVFRYFNQQHEKGDTGYVEGETIFIKINAVTAWGGAWPNGDMSASRKIEYDTSPQMILAMLRQLVNKAGVPQEMIYIGDPLCDIYNHIYNYLVEEFPDVNYVSQYGIPNRYALTKDPVKRIYFADEGSEMPNEDNNSRLFTEMVEADYLLNIPTMKGHRWAGVTFFAKNHFGSNTWTESWHMHPGLINNDNISMRTDYSMYRVLVELMGSKYLGRNTLLFCMEALWSTSYEHQPAQKFLTTPFNNDYSSSILLSLDPVAIESVGLDILQKEFTEEEIIDGMDPPMADRWTFVQFGGIDDYLHQAASSEWWPEGISYDPDNSGTPIPSLGTHEHWNNGTDMEYSRNLGSGEGIELIKLFMADWDALQNETLLPQIEVYPNPFRDQLTMNFPENISGQLRVELINLNGQLVAEKIVEKVPGITAYRMNFGDIQPGNYVLSVITEGPSRSYIVSKKLRRASQ